MTSEVARGVCGADCIGEAIDTCSAILLVADSVVEGTLAAVLGLGVLWPVLDVGMVLKVASTDDDCAPETRGAAQFAEVDRDSIESTQNAALRRLFWNIVDSINKPIQLVCHLLLHGVLSNDGTTIVELYLSMYPAVKSLENHLLTTFSAQLSLLCHDFKCIARVLMT